MKFKATIFVEGDADSRFIECFVKQRFNYQLSKGIELQKVNGKDSLHKFQVNFQENTKQQITNLIIFDANGNFLDRRNQLIQKQQDLSISFEQFLLPSNKDSGNLEDLLENIVNPVYSNILSCFDQFGICLANIGRQEIRRPHKKEKIYLYASLLSTNELAKESKRDYLNRELWHLESPYLDSLHQFLKPHFVEE